MDTRAARQADVETVTRCIELAFATDPIWSVALRRPDGGLDHLTPYWRLFVVGALRFGTVYLADDGAAVSVWIPPDGTELDEVRNETLERFIGACLDEAGFEAIHQLYGRFERSRAERPTSHYYLSLLATHPDHRGRGIGQALLADDLARWDAEDVPCYLESTNPANDHRYERLGFRSVGGFAAVLDDSWVTAMWRPVGGEAAERPDR